MRPQRATHPAPNLALQRTRPALRFLSGRHICQCRTKPRSPATPVALRPEGGNVIPTGSLPEQQQELVEPREDAGAGNDLDVEREGSAEREGARGEAVEDDGVAGVLGDEIVVGGV